MMTWLLTASIWGKSGKALESARRGTRDAKMDKRRGFRRLLELEALEDRTMPSWTGIGPSPQFAPPGMFLSGNNQAVSGRVSALAFTRNLGDRGQHLVLGAAGGGVWVGTNVVGASPTWAMSNTDDLGLGSVGRIDGLAAGYIDVGSLAVDPNNALTMYAGTGEANYSGDSRYGTGILQSTDAGTTWNLLATGSVANPAPNLMIAASPTAFFRHSISKILVDPNDSTTLYASVVLSGLNDASSADGNDGIYKSTDSGRTWIRITGGGPNAAQIGTEITVTDMDYTWDQTTRSLAIYAGVRSNLNPLHEIGGIWRSTDGGASWTHLGELMQGGAAVVGTFAPAAPAAGNIGRIAFAANAASGHQEVYAAVAALEPNASLVDIYGTQNGVDWTTAPRPGGLGASFVGTNGGQYDMAIGLEPISGRLYVGGLIDLSDSRNLQHGVYESNAAVTSWTAIDVDAAGHSPHTDVHAFAFDNGAMYIGTDGGVWRYDPSATGIGRWTDLNTGGLNTIQSNGVALDPRTPSRLLEGSQDNGIALTSNGGARWSTIGGGDGGLVRFENDQGPVIFGYKLANFGELERSDDSSHFTTWVDEHAPGNHDPAKGNVDYPFSAAFAVNPVSGAIAIGSNAHVYENTRPQFTGPTAWDSIRNDAVDGAVTALAYAPDQAGSWRTGHMYVGYADGKLFYTADDGATWRKAQQPWGVRPISGIAVDPDRPNDAFVTIGSFIDGADPNVVGQVWATFDFGLHWSDLSGGRTQAGAMPNVPVNAIVVDPSTSNTVRLASCLSDGCGGGEPFFSDFCVFPLALGMVFAHSGLQLLTPLSGGSHATPAPR